LGEGFRVRVKTTVLNLDEVSKRFVKTAVKIE
jgi:hypothetical protein